MAATFLAALAADAARQLHVLRHDRNALGVDGAQVRVLEDADHVRLSRFVERKDCGRLESKVGLEILRDLANQALERELLDEELRRALVLADIAKGDRSRTIAMRLLHSSSRNPLLRARRLGRELLAQRLAARRLARVICFVRAIV